MQTFIRLCREQSRSTGQSRDIAQPVTIEQPSNTGQPGIAGQPGVAEQPAGGETPAGGCDGGGSGIVVLEEVAAHGWRASDARLPDGHARRLLGFIEEREGDFEVMELGNGFSWSTFPSLQEAVAHLRVAADEPVTRRLSSDLRWIH